MALDVGVNSSLRKKGTPTQKPNFKKKHHIVEKGGGLTGSASNREAQFHLRRMPRHGRSPQEPTSRLRGRGEDSGKGASGKKG